MNKNEKENPMEEDFDSIDWAELNKTNTFKSISEPTIINLNNKESK